MPKIRILGKVGWFTNYKRNYWLFKPLNICNLEKHLHRFEDFISSIINRRQTKYFLQRKNNSRNIYVVCLLCEMTNPVKMLVDTFRMVYSQFTIVHRNPHRAVNLIYEVVISFQKHMTIWKLWHKIFAGSLNNIIIKS